MDATSIVTLVEETATGTAFGIWFLIGAALVFFMQAGFAMVETGLPEQRTQGIF